MNFKKIGIIFFLVIFLFPIIKINAQNSNIGFIPSNLWYSKDPFTEGDKIKIYTVIFNPESRELSGTVNFFDQEILLGKKDFKLPAKSAKDLSIDWTVTAGKHTIFAKIENARLLISKDKYENVFISDNETEKSIKNISKKIIETTNKNTTSETDTADNSAIENVKNIIQQQTPAFLAKPIITTTDAIERFRGKTAEKSDIQKEEAKKEIEKIKINEKIEPNDNKIVKPFAYLKMFFFQLVSWIFNNKYIFYGALFVLVFLSIRIIWNKVF